ncbi:MULTISPECIES: hypothetical protein [Bacteria]|jgi:hypothetical protein|uniref:hypothetical protein n=1 Tax=Bacteria TaxID=2 RepID=UPI00272A6B9D|nr:MULTISPECIES: hypothetical protein [Bacteria]
MDVGPLLAQIATVVAVLLGFMALFLYGVTKFSDSQGGIAEKFMIGCIIGAISCTAAASFISVQNLSISF